MPSFPDILYSKGWLGAATSLYSKGWLNYDIEIEEGPVVPPELEPGIVVPGTGGSSRTRPRRKQKLRKKRITVRVHFSGNTYEKTVIVAPNVNITTANVSVEKSGDQLEIRIKVGDIFLD